MEDIKSDVATNLVKIGPVPPTVASTTLGVKGKSWIRKIFITYEKNNITSLQFLYVEDDGKSVLSDLYGERCGNNFRMVTLPTYEHITGLSGTYVGGVGHEEYNQVISITLHTNQNQYGPFGDSISYCVKGGPPQKFMYKFGPGNQFGGFHGSFRDGKLESIGVYVNYD